MIIKLNEVDIINTKILLYNFYNDTIIKIYSGIKKCVIIDTNINILENIPSNELVILFIKDDTLISLKYLNSLKKFIELEINNIIDLENLEKSKIKKIINLLNEENISYYINDFLSEEKLELSYKDIVIEMD